MKNRIDKIIKAMHKGNLDAIAVIAGPNMAYLTGGDFFLMERPTVLIFSKNKKPVAILPSLEVDSFLSLNFDSEIIDWKDSEGYLSAFVKAGKIIGNIDKIGVEGQRMRVFEFNAMKHGFPNTEVIDAHNDIASIRLCKDQDEINNLKKAVTISEESLKEVLKSVKEGITESELAEMLIIEQYNRGAQGIAVHPLVLIGENSALPHGHAGSRKLKAGDSLLFDFGCIYNGYISDFTRTFFYKEVSDSNKDMYEIVEEANKIGRNLVKVGTSLHEIDDTVTKFLEESPYKKFIGHRTGHGLGMEVHEDPSVVRGNHLKLQEGMVITIEPGLYDKGNVGIRIEDNVVVTKEGHESMTILPRELIVL